MPNWGSHHISSAVLTTLHSSVRKVLFTPSVRAATAFGFGGIGFAVANILLAKYLDAIEFGILTLLLAFNQLGYSLGPAGLDLIVNRYRPRATQLLALRVLMSTFLVASITWVLVVQLYDVNPMLAAGLFLMILGSSVNRIGAALYRARQHFGISLALIQVHNYALLLAVPLALWLDLVTPLFFVAFATSIYLLTALTGWFGARRQFAEEGEDVGAFAYFGESLAGMGIASAPVVLMQAERFLIPQLLSFEQLAVFGVLAAVVGAPFRMLQIAMGYTLLPRLRATASQRAALTLLKSEVRVAVALSLCLTVAVLLGGPLIIIYFLDAKYDISWALMLATIFIGYIRIWQSIVVSCVSALGTLDDLKLMNLASWSALPIAVVGAWSLSAMGLLGIVCGVGLAWSWRCVVGSVLARRILANKWSKQEDQIEQVPL